MDSWHQSEPHCESVFNSQAHTYMNPCFVRLLIDKEISLQDHLQQNYAKYNTPNVGGELKPFLLLPWHVQAQFELSIQDLESPTGHGCYRIMPNPTFPFMWYDSKLWDLPDNNWLGLFWLNSILFFLWQNVQPQTTLSPHPSSALMIFTSTFILPAGTCHNSTIKNKNHPEAKKKIAHNQCHTDSWPSVVTSQLKKNQEIQLLLLGKYSSAQGTLPCLLPGSLSVHPCPQSGVSKRNKQKLSRPLRKECSWRYSVDGLDALGRYPVRKILPVIQPGVLKEFRLIITRTKVKISYKPSLHH
jgi:hypothetical protein